MTKKYQWGVVFSLMIFWGLCSSLTVSADVVDRIVAVVNEDVVTLIELEQGAAPYMKKIESSGYTAEKKEQVIQELNQKVLDAMIDRTLTQQEVRRYNINVSDAEIDQTIENFKKSRNLDQDTLEMALKQEGMTMEKYRETLKDQILQSRLIDHAVKSKVVITESDIKTYYDAHQDIYAGTKKYHLRNILMKDEAGIRAVKDRLKTQNFSDLAKQYSIASNANDGGDLGVFDISNFSESIKISIAELDEKEFTDVIQTAQGFQIFYVEKILLEDQKTLEDASEEIHAILNRQQVEKKFKTWLEELKKRAHIKIML